MIVGYFVLMLGIGGYFYRHMRAMKDYFSGGNRIPWWLSGVSFYMSSFSVAAFVQYSALAYKYGWVSVTLYWVTVPAMLISVFLLARRWRRARIGSPVEYLEERYSPAVRQVFAWQGIPVTLIDDALKLIAIGGMFIAPVLGLDDDPATKRYVIIGVGLIMLTYTFMGGLWAVMVTDFIQFLVMAAAVIVLLPLSIQAVGGLGDVFLNAQPGFFKPTADKFGWTYIVCNVLLFSLALGTRWSLVQRYYCVPKERDAFKVGILVVIFNTIGPPLMFLPAMAAARFLPNLTDDEVYAQLCLNLLPAGMLGLVIAAMFAATMSMLSSDYNVCASVLTNDVYRRLIRPNAGQKELVAIGRVTTLLVGAIPLAIAVSMQDSSGEGLFRKMVTLFSFGVAPVALPMIAGLLSRRVTSTAALGGFLGGLLTGLIVFLTCPGAVSFTLPLGVYDIGVVLQKEHVVLLSSIASTLFWMALVSRVDRHTPEEHRRVGGFARRLEIPIGQSVLDRDAELARDGKGASPFRVVGISTLLIGALLLGIAPLVQVKLAFWLDVGIGGGLALIGLVITVLSKYLERLHEDRTLPSIAAGVWAHRLADKERNGM